MDIIQEIKKLKEQKNAIVLAHCYQNVEIDEVADYVGDSLYLSKVAAQTDADIIVFAGVYFMAQSAKLLSPEKKVLLPDISSGCLMADMIDVSKLTQLKAQNPNVPVVCYINSTAEVKALCDVCCTSSNAINVVKGLGAKKILFVPDENLGNWVKKNVDDVELITFKGCCPIHYQITKEDIENARKNYPEAIILTHPEAKTEVCELSDFVGSTKEIMEYVKKVDNKLFVIATEKGVVDRLNRDSLKENWGKKFVLLNNDLVCSNMKKNTLESIYNCLLNENNEIFVSENIFDKARASIDKMFEVCANLK